MLRTRAPVVSGKASFSLLPLDLHVLGLPLAFILSQDQTLHCKCLMLLTLWNRLTSPPEGGDDHPPGGEWILGCCIKSKNVVSYQGRGPSSMAFLSKRTAKVCRFYKPPRECRFFFRPPFSSICQRVSPSSESGGKDSAPHHRRNAFLTFFSPFFRG